MKNTILLLLITTLSISVLGQSIPTSVSENSIPAVYSGIIPGNNGALCFISVKSGDTAWMKNQNPFINLKNIRINPIGNKNGILFDFKNNEFYGTIYYGLFAQNKALFAQPVYFKKSSKIIGGKASIDLSELQGKYDIANWEKSDKAMLGYRIINNYGSIIYDGNINIDGTGPFKIDTTIIAGPYINELTSNSTVISFETNFECKPTIIANNANYGKNLPSSTSHEILINNLKPSTKYEYTIVYGDNMVQYHFSTAPRTGSRTPFTFAFTSDSRNGNGGGERNIFGVNAYIMKRMAVLAASENVSFFQFTGDLISGYSSSIDQTDLEYANWKKVVEPIWHYIPFNIGMGNHEALVNEFDDKSTYRISVDKFPFKSNSAEAVFSRNFVNPKNDLISEDGAYYDPKEGRLDFPEYGETVYYYIYNNVAMVVLNSNYWYTPSTDKISEIGGNPHGYIMDNQLIWFKNKIEELSNNADIDHIFVTIHTPAFPNAGHARDDMWYNGHNYIRPTVAGIKLDKGIIERRDEFLDIMINKSDKVVALLCGDEHNYTRMKITNKTNIYPENYKWEKLKIKRPLWQITNGSAGAPYYGQQSLPWSESVEIFSTQYALNLFDIDGKKIRLRVINPDTLEEIETIDLVP